MATFFMKFYLSLKIKINLFDIIAILLYLHNIIP